MSPVANRQLFSSSAATDLVNAEEDEIVPMELDHTLPEPLILERSADLSTLQPNNQQDTVIVNDFLSSFDWTNLNLEELGDNEPSKSDCRPETTIGIESNNSCCNGGKSVELEEIHHHLLEDEQRHREDLQFLDDLDVQSLYFYSNPSSDTSAQAACSASTVPSTVETPLNSEDGDDIAEWLISLRNKIDMEQNATTNYDQTYENMASTEFSASSTTCFNYPNFTYTQEGTMLSLTSFTTSYEDLQLFKLPKRYYCSYCFKYFWSSQAVLRHKHKKRILRCRKCLRNWRTLDELKRHIYFNHDTNVMHFRPALPNF